MLPTAVLVLLAASGCEEDRTAVERGEALFRDPALSTSPTNFVACDTCHSAGEATSAILPGGSLAGVVGRPTYWGGTIRDLRDSVNACLRFFMRHPNVEALSPEDPDGLDLLAYLESLGTEPMDAVAFTIPRDLPPSVPDDLPAGDAVHGATVYLEGCRSCHGDKGTGAHRLVVQAALIPEDTLVEHGPVDGRFFTMEKVRHGQFFGIGGDMPPFSLEVLSQRDLADVLAYLGY